MRVLTLKTTGDLDVRYDNPGSIVLQPQGLHTPESKYPIRLIVGIDRAATWARTVTQMAQLKHPHYLFKCKDTQRTTNEGNTTEATTHGFKPSTVSPLLPKSNYSVPSGEMQKEQNYWTQPPPSIVTDRQYPAKPLPTSNRLLSSMLSSSLFPNPSNDNCLSLSSLEPCKPRLFKQRIPFSEFQVWQLEKRFRKQHYLTSHERVTLAHVIGLTPTQVK
ncbi:Homeobox protein LOX10 [Taenia solium]|eukprot:TsM_000683500 transcript=TsM_000683500 gene=TsM_000683500